jgi:predicted dehydrogenase
VVRVAVIGAGRWGPNLIRNFDGTARSEVLWVVDGDPRRLEEVGRRYPRVRLARDAAEALADPALDAVAIATPTVTHHPLVRAALEHGKHVLVEKPLAASAAQGRELVELAERADRVLLVGHVFLYNAAIVWIKRYLEDGGLGRIYYLASLRTNLGPIRMDVNAAWDLASHDLSIFDYWLGTTPNSVSASGGTWINGGIEDVVFATLRYPGGVLANVHVSWLNPRKVRDITLVGERRMLNYDEMDLQEPIRIYDKRVSDETQTPAFVDSFASFRASIRDGDITIPPVGIGEPLRVECEHFLDCVEGLARPRSGAREAQAVLETLEAIERSMRNAGREEPVRR